MPHSPSLPDTLPPPLYHAVARLVAIAALVVALATMIAGGAAAWSGRSAAQVAVISGMAAAVTALIIPLLLRPRLQNILARLHRALIVSANRDSLSGLDSRAAFLVRAEQARRAAQRNQHRFAILFIDGDGFKAINDGHGHAVGDQVIAEVGSRMLAILRAGDMAARMGGDEFAILLQRVAGRDDADAVVERLASAMTRPVTLSSGENLLVRLSIGIAVYPDDGDAVTALVSHADAAMYTDKVRLRIPAGPPSPAPAERRAPTAVPDIQRNP